MSENIKDFDLTKRLWFFQSEDFVVAKNKKAGKGDFAYMYATLDSLITSSRPYTKKHGIAHSHSLTRDEKDRQVLITKIFSSDNKEDYLSCETLVQSITFRGMNEVQSLGSQITYLKRYHLAMLLGLTTEEDVDAGGKGTDSGSSSGSDTKQTVDKTNYVAIYQGYLDKNKYTKDAMLKSFDSIKNKIDAKDAVTIAKLIEDKYKE